MNKITLDALKTVLFLVFVAVIITSFATCGLMLYDAPETAEAAVDNSFRTPTVIVIDPGHGGEDGGAEVDGIIEKNINLSISKALSAYLDISCFDSVMTRSEDVLLYKPGEENSKKRHDLLNRVEIAESFDDAVFVSIHQNKFEIPKYKGLQVYYSPNNADSNRLAEIIQSNARANLDNENKREVKRADFRIKVLDMLEMPAVLVECGFLSNPEEARLLNTGDYQKKIAFVIYLSIIECFENNVNAA